MRYPRKIKNPPFNVPYAMKGLKTTLFILYIEQNMRNGIITSL